MARQNPNPRLEKLGLALTPVFALTAGLVVYLGHHHYALTEPEALMALAGMAAIGLVLGGILCSLRSPIVAGVFFAVMVIGTLDLHYQFIGKLHFWILGGGLSLTALALVLSLRGYLGTIGGVSFGTMLLSSLLIGGSSAAVLQGQSPAKNTDPVPTSSAADLPVVVHLVLDGFVGLEGLPEDVYGASELKNSLTAFFHGEGFRTHDRAYSQYFLTHNSLANLFNNESSDRDRRHLRTEGRTWVLAQNRYFRRLAAQGYQIRVLQTDHMDFCRSEAVSVASCDAVPAFSLASLKDLPLSATQKAKQILGSFLTRTALYHIAINGYGTVRQGAQRSGLDVLPTWPVSHFDFYSLPGLEAFQRLNDSLRRHGAGQAYFAHVLLPHAPYFLTPECEVKPDTADWGSRRLGHHNLAQIGTPAYRAATYRAYVAQTHCVRRQLAALFDTLRDQGLWDRAVVLVHGDHGSRITIRDAIAKHGADLTDQDLLAAFSTLFAVRRPDLDPGAVDQPQPLQSVFAPLFLGEAGQAPEGLVYLEDRRGNGKVPLGFEFPGAVSSEKPSAERH